MLTLNEQLFRMLEKQQIVYSAFKSLEHLHTDLEGNRGDVDIWINKNDKEKLLRAAKKCGFFQVRWSSTKGTAFILIGWDLPSGKKVLVHVHTAPIAVKKRSYIPLYFTYEDVPLPKRTKYTVPLPSQEWVDHFENNRKTLKSTSDFKLLERLALHRDYLKKLRFKFSMIETLRVYPTYFRRFIVQRGHYRIRKRGLLIAFVGIDGSGKSSAVETLHASDFLKTTFGIRQAYFGNKNFWIPGVEKGRAKDKKLTPLKKLLMGLGMIDIKLRVIPALLAKWRGSIVLCDRYFYDSMVSDPTKKYLKSKLLRSILNPVIMWMPAKPDVTFYMQVHPKTAYARKQDYPFEKVERSCREYDKLMLGRPEVRVIDANQPLDAVEERIRLELHNFLEGR